MLGFGDCVGKSGLALCLGLLPMLGAHAQSGNIDAASKSTIATLEPHGEQRAGLWMPVYGSGRPFFNVDEIEFKPWAQGLFESRQQHDLEPHARCKASGAIRQFLTPYGVEIVEIEELERLYIFDIGGPHTFREVFTWVLDPIDGTVNYLYGLPVYAVSVAVVAGEPDPATWTQVAGAVASAADTRTWTAGRGLGAWQDGTRLRVNEARPLAESLVGTGFGYAAELRRHQSHVLTGVLDKVRDIRRAGSCAIDLCSVASGQLDVLYERGTNAWDFAAGGLVVREAGGVVTGLRGAAESSTMLLAGPRETVAQFAQILENLEADAPL